MQLEQLNNNKKFKILGGIIAIALLIFIPLSSPNFTDQNQYHVGLHISSIIVGTFLSFIGMLTYSAFRTTRLFLVMCAFMSITALELSSIITFILASEPPTADTDSIITHGTIFVMLLFFAVGIFRSD